MSEYTFDHLFDQLEQEGVISAETRQSITPPAKRDIAQAWYIRFLVGFSAWIASLLFITFLGIIGVVDNSVGALIVGGVFAVLTTAYSYQDSESLFGDQLALALSFAGRLLAYVSITDILKETLTIAVCVAIIELILLLLYRDRVSRFVSVCIINIAVCVIFLDLDFVDGVPLLAGLLAISTVILWQRESTWATRRNGLLEPLAYGVVVSMMGILLLTFINFVQPRWWLASLIISGCTLWLVVYLLRQYGVALSHTVAIWCVALVVLFAAPSALAPGIVAGILLLLLGFWRGNRLLGFFGVVLTVLFIGRFYYDLEYTLLTKSYLLMAGGCLLLVARTIFNRLPAITRSAP